MHTGSCAHNVALDRAFSVALLAVAVTAISTAAGYYLGDLCASNSNTAVIIHTTDPYRGCSLFVEWLTRAARLCRPMLLQSLLLWLAPYTKLEAPISSAVFMDRGVSLGLALQFCVSETTDISVSLLPLLHTLITAVFILFTYSLHDSHTVRPVRDTCVQFFIASGFTFIVYIASSWIL